MVSFTGITSLTGNTRYRVKRDENARIFRMVQVPDTQALSRSGLCSGDDSLATRNKIIKDTMDWIVANSVDMVMEPGDLVSQDENTSNEFNNGQYAWANLAYSHLDNAGQEYLVAPAHHDYDSMNRSPRVQTSWDAAFPLSRFTWVDEAYDSTSANMMRVKSLGGKSVAFFSLEDHPRDAVITWVNTQINAYNPDIVVMATHYYLNGREHNSQNGQLNRTSFYDSNSTGYGGPDGQNLGLDTFNKVVAVHPDKVKLVVGQHAGDPPYHPNGWSVQRTDTVDGYKVHASGANYQWLACANETYLHIYDFYNDRIEMTVYNPYTDDTITEFAHTFTH